MKRDAKLYINLINYNKIKKYFFNVFFLNVFTLKKCITKLNLALLNQ